MEGIKGKNGGDNNHNREEYNLKDTKRYTRRSMDSIVSMTTTSLDDSMHRKRKSGRIRLNSGSSGSDSTTKGGASGLYCSQLLSGITQSSANGNDNNNMNMSALQYDVIKKPPENEMEAQRMVNNYMFGFRKWKSHLTKRPLSDRSSIVKELYADSENIKSKRETYLNVGNIVYVILIGWWLSLIYCIISLVMAITVFGYPYSIYCLKLAKYFIWPFGKIVYKNSAGEYIDLSPLENTPLKTRLSREKNDRSVWNKWTYSMGHQHTSYWRNIHTYIWLILGAPIMTVVHLSIFIIAWLPVITIPVAKVNIKTISKLIMMPPEILLISDINEKPELSQNDIILYTAQAVNIYYYKYQVDGVNIVPFNMFSIVIIALALEYLDTEERIASMASKCILSLISVIPLAYYVAMVISSISAQSNFYVGAVTNATFGSIVELILYCTALIKDRTLGTMCYTYLVKSALIGTLLGTMMLIPGIAMILGGLKHQTQKFNRSSTGVGATLLFISVTAVFAPTIFARAHTMVNCKHCTNSTLSAGQYNTQDCMQCTYMMAGTDDDMYQDHVLGVVYTCMIILPLSYIIGLVYTLKTHSDVVFDSFTKEHGVSHEDSIAHWGRVKGIVIMAVSVILLCLMADSITNNITPLLTSSGLSVYFIGATLVALIPEVPEIVIGIQFALQNNISLSIDVGMCVGIQVCMLQIPFLVVFDMIYSVGFYALFSDIHLFSVLIGVFMVNYIFQDGKSDYFQGSALVMSYLALMSMYFFSPEPADMVC